MDPKTIETLNDINRAFYDGSADAFSRTRQRPWRGWKRLLELVEGHLEGVDVPSVLDVGCGNGRFARFLEAHCSKPFTYVGVDLSSKALELARARLSRSAERLLIQHDVIASEESQMLPPEVHRPFSLVAAFGLLHHVPSRKRRRALSVELARRVDHQGILAISIWQFGRFERFRRKIVAWEQFARETGRFIDPAQLESGDVLLSWGAPPTAYRYCHFIDEAEADEMARSVPLECKASFTSDGATNNFNRYYIFTRRNDR